MRPALGLAAVLVPLLPGTAGAQWTARVENIHAASGIAVAGLGFSADSRALLVARDSAAGAFRPFRGRGLTLAAAPYLPGVRDSARAAFSDREAYVLHARGASLRLMRLSYGARPDRRVRVLDRDGARGWWDIAMNRRGDAVAAWMPTTHRRRPVMMSVRRRGHGFGRPIRIGTGVAELEVAIGAGGDAVVAWQRDDPVGDAEIVARRIDVPGRDTSRLQVLGETEDGLGLDVAVGRFGEAAIAWGEWACDAGEPGFCAPTTVKAAFAVPRRLFGNAFTVGSTGGGTAGGPGVVGRVATAIDSTGTSIVAWSGREGDREVLRAISHRAESFSPVHLVSAPNETAHLQQLEVADRGAAVVTWSATATGGPWVRAAHLRTGVPGAPETVASDSGASMLPAALAFDPREGSWLLAYVRTAQDETRTLLTTARAR